MNMQRFYEENASVDPDAQRAYEAELAEARESELDHAVGRGALRPGDRDRWRERLRREPDLAGEVLRELPSDPALGERNFAADPRLRTLAAQTGEWLEIPDDDRVIHYEADGGHEICSY